MLGSFRFFLDRGSSWLRIYPFHCCSAIKAEAGRWATLQEMHFESTVLLQSTAETYTPNSVNFSSLGIDAKGIALSTSFNSQDLYPNLFTFSFLSRR